MRTGVVIAVMLALVSTSALAGAAPADASGPASGAAAAPASDPPRETSLELVVQLRANGTARWEVRQYFHLETENDSDAFGRLAEEWDAGQTDVGYTADTFREFADLSQEATGREMAIPEDSVARGSDRVDNDTGVLTLSFTWTNFARRNGSRLVVSDAFAAPSGTWLPELEPDQALVIAPPPGFTVDASPGGPSVENQTLRWTGPTEFSDDYFADDPVVFGAGAPTPTVTPTPSPGGPGGGNDRGLLFGVLAALVLGGGLAAYRRFGDGDDDDPAPVAGNGTDAGGATADPAPTGGDDGDAAGGAAADNGGSSAGESVSEPTAAGPGAGGAVESVGADADEDGEDGEGDGEDGDEEDEDAPEPTPEEPFAGVDEELLSDEERVLRLLQANGGRMKQARIVKETGWSNAKVSQLLSGMADDGEIDKLRIGRENLISLPDVDVESVE